MTEQRFVSGVRIAALAAMAVVVVLQLTHIAFSWGNTSAWYYPIVFSLLVFFILVQLWTIRIRRNLS